MASKALDEKNAIEDAAERVAIAHVIEKLEVDGPSLQSPHQSGVMGEEGSGLRELRPGEAGAGGDRSIAGPERRCSRFSPSAPRRKSTGSSLEGNYKLVIGEFTQIDHG